jgi:hypothetical protein
LTDGRPVIDLDVAAALGLSLPGQARVV